MDWYSFSRDDWQTKANPESLRAVQEKMREAEITYIAGPMTGYHDWNIPAFAGVAARMRAAGFTTVNPHELHDANLGKPWDWYLRRDLAELVKCQRIVLLPGWADSRGATVEHHVAKALGLEVIYPELFEEWFRSVHR